MKTLRALELGGNEIEYIRGFAFSGLLELVCLNLQGLKIHVLEEYAFWEMPSLRELDLSFNQIVKISSGTFYGLSSIEYVDLSFNPLCGVEPYAFFSSESLSLQRFQLDSTFLKTLDICVFGQNPPDSLNLTNSQSEVLCNDDELCWIVEAIEDEWILENDDLECLDPSDFATIPIEEALSCPGKLLLPILYAVCVQISFNKEYSCIFK